jgi:hypothetical protein
MPGELTDEQIEAMAVAYEARRCGIAPADVHTPRPEWQKIAMREVWQAGPGKALVEALREAAECVEAWGAYADPYFQEKHDLAGDVARIRSALAPFQQEQKP